MAEVTAPSLSLPGERWLDVPSYEGLYLVSDRGRIWSSYGKGHFLKGIPRGPRGYERLGVTLCDGETKWQTYIHKLVMLAFAGPTPEGQEIRHLDGDPHNNKRTNLAFGSHKQNGEDMALHGSAREGARRGHEHFRAKLTEDLVVQIRREYAAGGVTERDLSSRHGVNVSTLHRLLVRKTWTHVA